VTLPGKTKRFRTRERHYPAGKSAVRKKAIVTLAKGQLLEDYGV
jgi:ribosomal protein L23